MLKNNKDIDNMLKFYMDVLHEVVYVNDLQVFNTSMKKRVDPTNVGTKIAIIYRKNT